MYWSVGPHQVITRTGFIWLAATGSDYEFEISLSIMGCPIQIKTLIINLRSYQLRVLLNVPLMAAWLNLSLFWYLPAILGGFNVVNMLSYIVHVHVMLQIDLYRMQHGWGCWVNGRPVQWESPPSFEIQL